MHPAEQPSANHKNQPPQSTSGSKPKRRTSLFPLRGSANRKSNAGLSSLFDPHESHNWTDENPERGESESGNSVDQASNRSLRYRASSGDDKEQQSPPKTPRSVPKQYMFDTPFVQLVHEPLTRTVWQSDEIIQEQGEEYEKKQSQSHWDGENQIILEGGNDQSKLENSQQDKAMGQDIPKRSRREPQCSVCNQLYIKIQPSQPKLDDNLNKLSVGQAVQHIAVYPTNLAHKSQSSQQTMGGQLKIAQKYGFSIEDRRRNFGLTCVQIISVPPKDQSLLNQAAQTFERPIGRSQLFQKNFSSKNIQSEAAQTSPLELKKSNKTFQTIVRSKKKTDAPQQTYPLKDKLAIVQEVFFAKVGEKFLSNQQFQTDSCEKKDSAVQTEAQAKKQLKIYAQGGTDVLVSYNYQSLIEKKLDLFQVMLKELIEQNEAARQKNPITSESIGIQVDEKSLGPKTSLKRVSIGPTKVIYDQNEEAEKAAPNDQGRNRRKNRRGRSKGRQQILQKQLSDLKDEEYSLPQSSHRKKGKKSPSQKKSKR